MRSSTRRACCASTRFVSICRGCSKAARIALGVISLNVTRKIFFGSRRRDLVSGLVLGFILRAFGLVSFFLTRDALGSCSSTSPASPAPWPGARRWPLPRGPGRPPDTRHRRHCAARRSLITLPLPAMICSVGSKILSSSSVMGLPLASPSLSCAFFARAFFLPLLSSSRADDADGLLRQVHHVADRRLDRIVASQIFVDRLRLGGRFDDDQ